MFPSCNERHRLSDYIKSDSLTNTLLHQATEVITMYTVLSLPLIFGRLRLESDGTRAETRFRLSAKRTSPFKSAGASVQSTTGS